MINIFIVYVNSSINMCNCISFYETTLYDNLIEIIYHE